MVKFLALAVSIFLFVSGTARAEHTPDHRFTITGYVYTDAGKPVPGQVVVKDSKGAVLGTTEAGKSGYYRIKVHLHDTDAGSTLTIDTEAGKKDLVVQFEPTDKKTERTAELNFGAVPPPSGFMENKAVLFGIIAVVSVGTVYLFTRKRKKPKQEPEKKKHKKKSSQPAST